MRAWRIIFFAMSSYILLLQPLLGQADYQIETGDDFQFEQFSINQGLSHVGVTSVLQDKTGFIWVGTYDGLNRFDGLNVEIFKKDPDNPSSLINNRIHSIFQDHQDRLWIGTEEGVSVLDLETYKFTRLRLPEQLSDIKPQVYKILNVHKNETWILTANYGLMRFTAEGDYILGVDISGIQSSGKPLLLDAISVNDNEYLICTSRGLYIYYTESNEFLRLYQDEIGNARCVARTGDIIYVGTINGMAVLNVSNSDIILDRFLFQDQYIFSILIDKDENIWIGTSGNGLYYGEQINGQYKFTLYNNNPFVAKSLSDERISYIYQDDLSNFWIGSLRKGLFRVDTKPKGFITVRNTERFSNIAPSSSVTCLSKSNGTEVFVGFLGEGLQFFDPVEKEFVHLPFKADILQNITVSNVFTDSHNILWILSWGSLYRVLPGTQIPERIIPPDNISGQLSCISVEEDKFGRIWIGTRTGLLRIKMDNNLKILDISPINGRNNILGADVVQSLYFDNASEELWIGTQHSGLFILPFHESEQETSSSDFIKYTDENTGRNGLKSNFISCIHKSSAGDIYIGTEGGGITKVSNNDGYLEFSNFSTKQGLLNNTVKSIQEDVNNQFWIGTNNGLFRFDPVTESFAFYTYRDGIQSNAFNYPSFKNDDGYLFFGGVDGFTYFNSQNIHKDINPPRIIFGDFYLSYKKVPAGTEFSDHTILPSSLSFTDTLVLEYNENTFSAEIIPIQYNDPSNNRIKYRLVNYDNGWIDADAYSNIASYSKLRPGHYKLQAIASNSDDIWTPEPEELNIIIKPPIWQTKIAFVIYFILFSLTLYLAYRIISRITRLRNDLKIEMIEKAKESELHEAKLRFFTNISHEFKTPISLILGPVQWLSERLTDNPKLNQKVGLINNQANYLLKLVEQLLEFRKAEKDTVKLECSKLNIIEFIRNIKDSFDIYAKQKNITFELDSSHSSISIWFDANKMEKIINNILSNAFKYTNPGGIISINIKGTYLDGERNGVQIHISDTGTGISKDSLHRVFDRFFQENEYTGGGGIGLSLTKSLVDLHKGKIWVESEEGKGSTFSIEFLSGDEHLEAKDKLEDSSRIRDMSLTDVLVNIEGSNDLIRETDEIFHRGKASMKRNLLIVEDHYELRNFIREAFHDSFRVLVAENGVEALEIIEKEFPIAIISDVLMPEMDGIELCRKIKTNKSFCHIPVILLTSKESHESRIEGLETGADAYITKPFQINHLMVQLNNILENREILYEKLKNGLPLDLEEVQISSMEGEFLEKVMSIVKDHLEDPDFDSIQFAREMYMNRTHFYRKMKAITNLTPGEFLRNYRLTIAAELIAREKLNVSEVIYRVGMKSRSNFTRCFKEKFGINPQEYKTSVLR
jgi:signal transduction histidine kinase/ligand-binding sensor domain-containing protein/DNA-binding response OmpR family regulator